MTDYCIPELFENFQKNILMGLHKYLFEISI